MTSFGLTPTLRRQTLGQRVEHHGAVRIDDAFRLAGRAGGVAHRHGFVFVEVGVVEFAAGGRQEALVILVAVGDGLARQRDDDDFLDVDLVFDARQQRQQHVVHDDEAVAGMVDDVGEVNRRQAQIERVQHAARAGDAEIGFEMRVVIPGQRADAVAALKPGFLQRLRQQARAAVKIGISVGVQRLVRHPRDDLDLAVESPRMFEDVRQG